MSQQQTICNITLADPLHIRLESDDYEYLQMMKTEMTFKIEGYQFMPKYKAGIWSGDICLIKANGKLPYGLLFEILKINKNNFPRPIKTTISQEVKDLFKGQVLEPEYDLELFPRPYQSDCIEKALKYTKGIFRVATAGGKSLIIAYIIKTILDNKQSERILIVVPTKSLVSQMYDDFKKYDVKYSIGRVYQKYKEWNNNIVIATWQTLIRNTNELKNFQSIIVDECHGVKAHSLSTLLKKTPQMKYRFGCTGTLHAGKLDNLNVNGYLGTVIAEYSSNDLAEQGYISKCNVNIINISYMDQFEGTYNEVKDLTFSNDYRLSVLKTIVKSIGDDNVLLLVGKVEKEGEYLRDWLEGVVNKEVVFLSGRDDVEEREKWRKRFEKKKNIVLIATYGILSTGVNIPSLKYTVLAAPFKSKIRVLQSIGRNLRKHESKEESGATIFDIHDETKYLAKHNTIRARYYDMEGFAIKNIVLNEGDPIEL